MLYFIPVCNIFKLDIQPKIKGIQCVKNTFLCHKFVSKQVFFFWSK